MRGGVRWQPPPSTIGRLMLGGYVAGAALFEELLWRAPVTLPRTARGTAGLAAASAAGFMALHLRRDGTASVRAHLLATASWTGSTLIGHRLRWPVLSHALYNYAALTLRPVLRRIDERSREEPDATAREADR